MTTIMPDDELLRKAVRHIDAMLKSGEQSLDKALDDAAMRFNLGPAQCEYLRSLFKSQPEDN